MIKLLNEYEQRLEGIESFVYMHCVGIQLEKHCSKRRAKALSGKIKMSSIDPLPVSYLIRSHHTLSSLGEAN